MKINENSKNFVSKIVIVLLTIITLNYTNVFATNELKPGEKSAEYKKWENLSEEERKNSIEPAYYEIDLKKSIKRSNYNAMLASNENMLGDSYDLRESSKNLNGIKIINKKRLPIQPYFFLSVLPIVTDCNGFASILTFFLLANLFPPTLQSNYTIFENIKQEKYCTLK